MWQHLLPLSLALSCALGTTVNFATDNGTVARYSFEVDYENDQFLLDGRPFRYVSGSFHYFRTPRQYWRDRLRKMRAAGLNAVSTYVEWSLHQPTPYEWNWTGDADLVEFLNIAREEDLLVLLRPGPYICAERDLGGLPYWLLTHVPDMRLRTNDTRYMTYVTSYMNVLLNKVQPYLRGNGGPIIMVQVENEYGSFGACDADYMDQLYTIFKNKIGNKALLYTTDGNSLSALRCGSVAGAYPTIDFGTSANVTNSFAIMRYYQPTGPLVNSEFYPGWLTHWEEPFQRVKTSSVKRVLDEMLAMGASVNIYMFYGGTNFAFTSGANGGLSEFMPQLTSYDYDAPLTEAGDLTEKYFEIRSIIAKYLPLPNISLPVASPKGNYGAVLLEPIVQLFHPRAREIFSRTSFHGTSNYPPTFETMNIPHGFALYEANLPNNIDDPAILYAMIKDRALVYVDDQLCGTLSRTKRIFTMPLESPYGKRLSLLVENQGHLNYGNEIRDLKGISDVVVNNVPLVYWNITGFPLATVSEELSSFSNPDPTIQSGTLRNGPVFLRGYFEITDQVLDTFLDTTGWGKGLAYVNGFNLGRYWPLAGPQMTLYVPATALRLGLNELIFFELEYIPATRKTKFQEVPNLSFKLKNSNEETTNNP